MCSLDGVGSSGAFAHRSSGGRSQSWAGFNSNGLAAPRGQARVRVDANGVQIGVRSGGVQVGVRISGANLGPRPGSFGGGFGSGFGGGASRLGSFGGPTRFNGFSRFGGAGSSGSFGGASRFSGFSAGRANAFSGASRFGSFRPGFGGVVNSMAYRGAVGANGARALNLRVSQQAFGPMNSLAGFGLQSAQNGWKNAFFC